MSSSRRADAWTIDSACSRTMKPDIVGVSNIRQNATKISLADDLTITASHIGDIDLPIADSSPISALVVPDLHQPLLSVADFCDKNLTVVFNSSGCQVYNSTSVKPSSPALGVGYCQGNLYYLPNEVGTVHTSRSVLKLADLSLPGYHRRLNHVGLKPLKKLLRDHSIHPKIMNEIEVQQCDVCVEAKMSRLPFRSQSDHRATTPGAQIHSDVCSFEEVS